MERPTLGPYTLDRPVRQGASGQVWVGRHVESGLDVALKVLGGAGSDPRARQLQRSEIRAMVALDHPRIVRVLEQLVVDGPLAERPDFEAGAPVLVMDLARGDLTTLRADLDWSRAGPLMLDVLDGLAHAHSRGVVHRDLKPANVLVDHAGRAVLTDFGLAWVDADLEAPAPGGTPAYMAPEQVAGRWRDTGPWTDLYSLGILAWALTTGREPFEVATLEAARQAHQTRELPAFRPRFAVPEALEGWIRRLVARDPSHRFLRAADAAWALARMLEPRRWVVPDPDMPPPEWDSPRLEDALTTLRWDQAPDDLPPPAAEGGLAAVERPPLPAQPPAPATQERPPPGIGASLAALRPVPFVDRDAERSVLWEALGRVHLRRGAQLVLIEGRSGYGKTRLATWLTETAHAVGAATVFHASHAEIPGPTSGLGPMMARNLRCSGLKGGRLVARIQGLLRRQGMRDPREWAGLAELIAPGEGPARFSSAREWYVLVLRLLERRCRERPVVLLLDDVQWGPDALGLVRELFSGRWRRLPVLVLLTARTEALAHRPAEAQLLDRTVEHAEGRRVTAGPLEPDDALDLLTTVIGDGPRARELCERADGHPLLAVQLARSHLTSAGSDAPSADLDSVWTSRVEQVLRGRAPSDRHALELAAVLGTEVDPDEWRAAGRAARLVWADDLVDALMDAELLVAGPEGPGRLWSFAHGGLREVLARGAREAGRWARWNQVAADLLADRGPASAGRRGQHLLDAGDLDGAVDALLTGASALLDRGDLRAELLLDRAEQALRTGRGDADPRWGEVLVQRGQVGRFLLDADQMDRVGEQLIRLATRRGWRELEARGHLVLGDADRVRSDPRASLQHLAVAERMARDLDAGRVLLEALEITAVMSIQVGAVEHAEGVAAEALSLCGEHGDPRTEAFARIALSAALLMQDRLDEAWEHNEAGRKLFERLHNWEMLAQVLNMEGEILRARGDLKGARGAYEEAIDVLRLQSGEDGHVRYVELNVALLLIEEGRFRDAEPRLWRLLGRFEEDEGMGPMAAAWCRAALLPCLASSSRWSEFDELLAHLEGELQLHEFAERDLARLAAKGGGLARQERHIERARRCWRVARDQYRRLGNPEEEERLARALAALPPPPEGPQ